MGDQGSVDPSLRQPAPQPGPDRRFARLPLQPTSFVGREREVDAVGELVRREDVRLVTLTGPGGVGKTRLALRVAERYDGADAADVAFVALAPVADPDLVGPTVARALGLTDAAARAGALAAAIGDRRLLLVLDNFEHVVAAAPFVGELLAVAPNLVVLVTSRAVLRLSGEHTYPVPPLSLPPLKGGRSVVAVAEAEAVRLFAARAGAACPSFALDDANAAAVAAICRRLDGLPLALELAAARTRVLPPAALLDRLDHALAVLTGGARDHPARLRTMRDAVAWSHDLLADDERALFRRLAVFAGGFTLAAATAVAADPGSDETGVLDGVAALTDASLLRREGETAGEPRYAMLEIVRAFGLERLAGSAEEATVRERHVAWALAMAETAWPPRAAAPAGRDALARLDAERDNLRAALAWTTARGDAATALRLAAALAEYWWLRGEFTEGRDWSERALALVGGPPALRAAVLYGAGALAEFQGDFAAARALAGESLALAVAHGDPLDVLRARFLVGQIMGASADAVPAFSFAEQTLAIARAVGDANWLGYATSQLGTETLRLGDRPRAAALFEQAVHLAASVGDRWGEMNATLSLAAAVQDGGDHARAAALYRRGIELSRAVDNPWGSVEAAIGLAALALEAGDLGAASRLLGGAEAVGDPMGFVLEPLFRDRRDRVEVALRASRDAEALESLGTEARALAPDDALAVIMAAAQTAVDRGRPNGAKDASILTVRELAVLRLLADHLSSLEIATALFISPRTVESHVGSILAKLGVANRRQAVAEARRRALLCAPPPGLRSAYGEP